MGATLRMLAQSSSSDPAGAIIVVGIILAAAVVWIAELVDALLVPDDSLYKAGSKVMWVCLIIFLGVIGALIYAAAGKPTRESKQRYALVRERKARGESIAGAATPLSPIKSTHEHEVYAIDGFYTCAADDCEFETSSITDARRHQDQEEGARVSADRVMSEPTAEGEHLRKARRISYILGTSVNTPGGDQVQAASLEDPATWATPDGGEVEPQDGYRFTRLSVGVTPGRAGELIGSYAYSFGLRLNTGDVIWPVEEWYQETELLAREDNPVSAGGRVEGDLWFEILMERTIIGVVFEEGEGVDQSTRDAETSTLIVWGVPR